MITKKKVSLILGVLSFAGSLIFMGLVIHEFISLASWSSKLSINLFGCLLLFLAGTLIIQAGGWFKKFGSVKSDFLRVLGIICAIAFITVYVLWGISHDSNGVSGEFSLITYGMYFISLTFLWFLIAFFWEHIESAARLILTGIMGLAALFLIFVFIISYSTFSWWGFLGELIIILIGAALFLTIFKQLK